MRACGDSSVGQVIASLAGGPEFESLRTHVKRRDMVAHTCNLRSWDVERSRWGAVGREGGRRGGELLFFLDLVFSVVDETLSGVSATDHAFARSYPTAMNGVGNTIQLQWIVKLLPFKITLPP